VGWVGWVAWAGWVRLVEGVGWGVERWRVEVEGWRWAGEGAGLHGGE
jgi:hypothetical protein